MPTQNSPCEVTEIVEKFHSPDGEKITETFEGYEKLPPYVKISKPASIIYMVHIL